MGTAVIWFRDGELIDAQCGKLRSVNAVFRALRFDRGSYVVEYGDPTRPVRIDAPLQSLFDEAARRAAQVSEIVQRLPSFDQLLVVNQRRLGPLDEEQRQLVGLFKPHCSIDEALDLSEAGELETLMLLEQLVDVGVLEPASNKPRYRADEPTLEIEVPPAVRVPDDEETTTVKDFPRRPSPPPVAYDEETTAVKEIPRRSKPAAVPLEAPLPELPKAPPKALALPTPSPPKPRPLPAAKPPPPTPRPPDSPRPAPRPPDSPRPAPRPAPLAPPLLSRLPPSPPIEAEAVRITPPPPPPRFSSVPPATRRRGLGLVVFLSAALAGALVYLYFEVWESRWPWVEAADLPASASVSAAPAPLATCPQGTALIEAGRFFMGTDSKQDHLATSVPAHQVELPAFCIGKNEVTIAEYEDCARAGKCARLAGKVDLPRAKTEAIASHKRMLELYAEHCNAGKPGRRNHPANCVTLREAEDYCGYKGERLPREAEWEYAARGSDGRVYPWGDDAPSAQHANACGGGDCKRWHDRVDLDALVKTTLFADDDGYGGTAPAGSFPAGAAQKGISDMIGNVAEWTADAFRPYRGAKTKLDADPSARSVRGGSFLTSRPEEADASARDAVLPSVRSPAIGFRCAANPR